MSARHHQDVLPYPNQMRNTIGNYDWKKAMRFSMYGSLVVAPTLYAWVRFSVRVFPHQSIGSAVTKAAVEQVTYGPAATCLFFFGMTLLESQDWQLAKKEVADKFFTTYKVSEPPNNLSLFENKNHFAPPLPHPNSTHRSVSATGPSYKPSIFTVYPNAIASFCLAPAVYCGPFCSHI